MRLPITLSLYIGRNFLSAILLAIFGIVMVVGLVEMVELLRRASGKEGISFGMILQMVFFKIPQRIELILPFAVLVGGMLALSRLTRSHELVVARAAGVSVWQFLMPAILLVMVIGIGVITVFNPISAVMAMKYDALEGKFLEGRSSLLAVSDSGLWLRQVEEDNTDNREYIIHAQRVSQKDMVLSKVIVFVFDEGYRFKKRLDAKNARLVPASETVEHSYWQLEDVVVSTPGHVPQILKDYAFQTRISVEQIQDSFASPETISFWQLPSFIFMLENAGFSALKHKLHLYVMLVSPLMLCAMIFIAAAFSLRTPRRGGLMAFITAGLLTGFVVRLMTDIIHAIGLSGALPLLLAAWTPAIICIMFGAATLLHLEDG